MRHVVTSFCFLSLFLSFSLSPLPLSLSPNFPLLSLYSISLFSASLSSSLFLWEWIPTIQKDQAQIAGQQPPGASSDAYLSSAPAKKRKVINLVLPIEVFFLFFFSLSTQNFLFLYALFSLSLLAVRRRGS